MITEIRQATFELRSQEQLSIARRTVQEWATALAFSTLDRTKLVTAASEIGRNALVHGGGGQMTISEISNGVHPGLRLVFEDQGAGIPNIELAMTNGFTTARSMGLGLGGSQRLVHEFDIASTVGQGTRVSLIQWKRR